MKLKIKKNKLFFIDTAAGTGKTFVNNTILAYTRLHNKVALGVAATSLFHVKEKKTQQKKL